MNVENTVRTTLLEYPRIFRNSLDVYNHLFCVIGNGYEWINGELVEPYLKYPKNGLSKEQALKKIFTRAIERFNPDHDIEILELRNVVDPTGVMTKKDYAAVIAKHLLKDRLEDLLSEVLLNNDIDKRMRDFKPYDPLIGAYKKYKIPFLDLQLKLEKIQKNLYPEDPENKKLFSRNHQWHLYPCSLDCSYVCNFPDDIKPDWLIAIDKMLWFISVYFECWDHEHTREGLRAEVLDQGYARMKEVIECWHGLHENGHFNEWKARNKYTSYLYNRLKEEQNDRQQ